MHKGKNIAMTKKSDGKRVEEVFSIGSTVMLNTRAAKLTANARCRELIRWHSVAMHSLQTTTNLTKLSNRRMALQQEQGATLKKRKTGITGLPAPYLPIPIWAQIASKMTIKEWARVCRTCRVMYRTQPDAIDIQQHYHPAGNSPTPKVQC